MKALLRALAGLLRPLAARQLLPPKLAKPAELLRPSRVVERLRPGSVAERLLPDAVTGWLGERLSPSEEDDQIDPPHEADLTEAVLDADGLPVQHAILVAVPVEIAYNQFTQFEDFPAFMRAVAKAEQIDPVQVEFELRRWGLRRSWRAHIVDQRPEERIAWCSVTGMRLAGVTTFHAIGARLTRVEVSVVVEPAGRVQGMARRLGLVDRVIAGQLNRFKAFIEMREEETGAWRGYIADGQVVDEDDYFGWEPSEGGRQGASAEDPAGPGSDPRGGPGTAASRGSPRGGRAASRGTSAQQQERGHAPRSNGASASKSGGSGTSAGKSGSSGAGPARASKQTGGSRTRA